MKKILQNTLIIILLIFMSGMFNRSYAVAPVLARPANNSYCFLLTDTLFFHPAKNKLSYTIFISTLSDMSQSIIMYQPSDTFFVPSALDPALYPRLAGGTQYYWKVRVAYGPGSFDSSAIWSFTTKQLPPVITSPDNNKQCFPKNATFSWSYNPGFQFRLQVSTTNTFSTTVVDMSGITTNSQTVTLPNYGTTYYWRVAATIQNCIGDWTTTRNITTSQTPPTLTAPAHKTSVSNISIPLRWSVTGNPLSYDVQVASDSDFTNVMVDDVVTVPRDTVYLGTSNQDYYWRVKTSYTGCETEWSNFFTFTTSYTAPTLNSPGNDTTCVPTITKLKWLAGSPAQTYRLNIAEDGNFNKIIINRAKILTLSDTITLPKGLQKYYWRVRGEDGNNPGLWSNPFSFTTSVGVPQRISPLDKDSGDLAVTFKWKPMDAGTYYRVQISPNANFSTTLLDSKVDLTSVQFTFSNYGKTYYWRISASIPTCEGAWSPTWAYKTALMPPTLISPVDNAVKVITKPRFQWSAPKGAEKYVLQVSLNFNFNPVLISKTGLLNNYFQTDKDLDTNTTYYWRVYSTNTDGISSWSNVFSFSTGGPGPQAPLLLAPPNNSQGWDTKVVVKWNSSKGAKFYHLQVSEADDFQNCLVDLDNLIETSYSLPTLVNGKVYYWKVSVITDIGISNWSETWNFKTISIAPSDAAQLLQPPNGTINLSNEINFSWSPVQYAENYDFQIASQSQFDTPDIVYSDTNVSTNSKYLTTVPFDSDLYWRVRGKNGAGNAPWSNPWKFTTTVNSVQDDYLAKIYNISLNPNPASESAMVCFNLPVEHEVTICIINMLGIEQSRYHLKKINLGVNVLELDLRNLNSGLFLLKITIGQYTQVQNLIIEK